jgi:hypothetical protein
LGIKRMIASSGNVIDLYGRELDVKGTLRRAELEERKGRVHDKRIIWLTPSYRNTLHQDINCGLLTSGLGMFEML